VEPFGWYFRQLLFHLTVEGPQGWRLQFCSRQQRQAVVAFLRHVAATRRDRIVSERCAEELREALELWDVA